MMGDKAILAFVGVMLILVVLSLDFLFILIRQYKRYKVVTALQPIFLNLILRPLSLILILILR